MSRSETRACSSEVEDADDRENKNAQSSRAGVSPVDQDQEWEAGAVLKNVFVPKIKRFKETVETRVSDG